MSEEKFSKCGEGEKCKCRISGVREKMKIERKAPEKRSILGENFLLSSCSLVNLQVKVMGENDENFQSIFWVGSLKLKLQFAEKGKVKEKLLEVVDVSLVGRHVVKHG